MATQQARDEKHLSVTQYIGILTAGGDSPGLNAAIRAVGKTGMNAHGMQIIGFRDGFRGLMENRIVRLDSNELSGILTVGGTILGTSRDKPDKMPIGGKLVDMTDVMVENYHKHHLDALVCLGGGGTARPRPCRCRRTVRCSERGSRPLQQVPRPTEAAIRFRPAAPR